MEAECWTKQREVARSRKTEEEKTLEGHKSESRRGNSQRSGSDEGEDNGITII